MPRIRGYLRGEVHPVTLRYRALRAMDLNKSVVFSARSDYDFPDDQSLKSPRISFAVVVESAAAGVAAPREFKLPASAFEPDYSQIPIAPAGDAAVSAALRDCPIPFPLERLYWKSQYTQEDWNNVPISVGNKVGLIVHMITIFICRLIDHNHRSITPPRKLLRVIVNITTHNNTTPHDQDFAINHNYHFFDNVQLSSKPQVNPLHFNASHEKKKKIQPHSVGLKRLTIFLFVVVLVLVVLYLYLNFEKML